MNYNDRPLMIFLRYLGRHKWLFALDMFCSIAIAAVDLVFPYVSRSAMNTYLPQNMYKTFFIVMAVLIAAYILRSAMYYTITVLGHRMGALVEMDMRRDIFEHMQTLSFSFYDKNRVGALMSRIISDLFEIVELAHHGPENIVISILTLVGAMIVIFSIEWRLAIIIMLVLPVCVWFTASQRNRMNDANIEVKKKTAVINTAIESGISGIRTAKAFANEDKELEKFDAANLIFRDAKLEFYSSMGLFTSGMEFTTSILSVVVILAGGIFIMNGKIDYVDLVTFSLYVTTFASPIRRLTQFAEQYMQGKAGFMRFLEIMRTEPEIKDAEDAGELTEVEGRVSYENVSFHYENGVPVLENVSLEIEPGEHFAFVGSSGGGKTTICQLLPRFYDVTGGAVKVDGKDVRSLTQHSLRKNIGIIQQDVFMFADTVRENIRYGRPDATDEEIIEAAKRAEIHDEIMQMPEGYDTYIGERGVMLSGGQKQRLSIARVFLKNPKILILDEATSALDTVTEQKIQRSLDELSVGRTTIIIAHRLSTVRSAAKIAVVEDEHITEFGTHRELISKGGTYAELVRAQSIG